MTTTGAEAYSAIRAHHRALSEGLSTRAEAVSSAVAARRPYAVAVADFIAFLAGEVLPHAAAEEKAIYPAVAAHTDLGDMVREMTAEHVTLSGASSRLAVLTDGAAAAGQARQISEFFAAHADKENDVLLPALLASQSVNLAVLLHEMHGSAELAGTTAAAQSQDKDPLAAVLQLLLQGASALARAGDADRACRIAASAWAALREARPDLAAKVAAALHGLTRKADGPAAEGSPDAGSQAADPDLDVRDLSPAQRHVTIFDTFHALLPGTGFVLVNDHDPKPLGYQFEAEHAGEFTWDYLESGPEVWRVRIGRIGESSANAGPGADRGAAGEEPDLDVRQVSHGQRHGLIFTAYRALQPGRGFILVNDHDPRPLKYQFEAGYADEFTWDYLESGPKEWRVRIGRASA